MQKKRILFSDGHAAFRQDLAFSGQKVGLKVVTQAGSLTEDRDHSVSAGVHGAVVAPTLTDGDAVNLLGELREAESRISTLVLNMNLHRKEYLRAREAGAIGSLGSLALQRHISVQARSTPIYVYPTLAQANQWAAGNNYREKLCNARNHEAFSLFSRVRRRLDGIRKKHRT